MSYGIRVISTLRTRIPFPKALWATPASRHFKVITTGDALSYRLKPNASGQAERPVVCGEDSEGHKGSHASVDPLAQGRSLLHLYPGLIVFVLSPELVI